MQSKLSKLQKEILSYLYNNRDKTDKYGLYRGDTRFDIERNSEFFYSVMKFDIAKNFEKLIPVFDNRIIHGKPVMRIKEAFHPAFRNSIKALIKRKLINEDGWLISLTEEGIKTVKELLKC
jgi:hypothetical protein